MATTYFNWHEILLLSKGDLAAIICLAYAQTLEYNEKSVATLRRTLKIHHFPQSLLSAGTFRQHVNSLECTYKTREPQSYFKNNKFLYIGAPTKDKVVYLRALSMRRPDITDNFIPRKYYTKVKQNFFLNITEDKIYFPYESSL